MSPGQFLSAAAGNAESLHCGWNALDHDGSRNDEASDDYVRFLFAEKGLLLDVESKPEVAVSQVFRGKTARHIDIRHNGRLDKHNTHFDIASAGEVRGDCSSADDEAGAFRAARTSGFNSLFSLSLAYSWQIVNGCNSQLNDTRSAFMSNGLIAAGRKGFAQIAGEGTGNTVRQYQPIDDAVFLTVRDPGCQPHLAIDALDIDASGKGIEDYHGFRQRWVSFISHIKHPNSQVPAQDSLGTALGESLCGKSKAAQRASEQELADADLNDGRPAGQTGIEVVTGGESAATISHSLISLPLELPLPSQRDRLGAVSPPAPSHQFTMVSA